MKCPKCGFNSFEYLDNCKKCNADLATFKQSLGIQPIILPATQTSPSPAPEYAGDATGGDQEGFTWGGDAEAGETPTFAEEVAPEATAPDDAFSFEDNIAPTDRLATPQPEAFGEFSFDDLATGTPASPASRETVAPPEPASNWTGGSEFSAGDFPGFADEPSEPGPDELPKREEAKPAKQQTPPADDLFNSDDFADLFKDDEQAK